MRRVLLLEDAVRKIETYSKWTLAGALAVVLIWASPSAFCLWRDALVDRSSELVSDGRMKVLLGLHDEAQELLERALDIDPDNTGALMEMGYLNSAAGRYADAADYFRRAAETSPANGDAWLNLGLACLSLEQYAEAEEAMRNALEADPNQLLVPYRVMAEARVRSGKRDEAIGLLEEGIAAIPDFRTYFLNTIEKRVAELGAEDEEERFVLERIMADSLLDEELAAYDGARVMETVRREQVSRLHFDLALLLAEERGTVDRAVEHYTQALAMAPSFADAYLNRAMLRFSAGDFRAAWEDLQRAQQLGCQLPDGMLAAYGAAARSEQSAPARP